MTQATEAYLTFHEERCEGMKAAVRSAADTCEIRGKTYYVSNDGDDRNDGTSPETPWRTTGRVSAARLEAGDGVLFRRGDLFRGGIRTSPGVTYAAYGRGDKPRIYGWDKNLADPTLWELVDGVHSVWHLKEKILDCGTLVFNEGEAHSRKLIPSYIEGRFVCRADPTRPFVMTEEMTRDLDLVCLYDARLTTTPSKGEDFPIPVVNDESYGDLYLRCDGGNPGDIFASVEALPRRRIFAVGGCNDVTVDNICIRYTGEHAIAGAGGCLRGLRVTNCEIGWVGGSIQHYFGTDPNYPQGGRGTVTRFGNAVEIYGGCDGYTVENCYIYQVYDAGITHQISTGGRPHRLANITYRRNLVEYCVYSIEYFLEKNGGDTESIMENCEICENVLRFSGYGWGQQRHNVDTPAHIKGWSYENTATGFTVHHNVFDRAAYRMLHLVAGDAESCPTLWSNTYVQTLGHPLGQYGSKAEAEPEILLFDDRAEDRIRRVLGDPEPTVITVE